MFLTRYGIKQKQPDRCRNACRTVGVHVPVEMGFTLVELMVVVFILSVIALIITPSLRPADPHKIELVAGEVAAAYRHARREALRTSYPHGVHTEPTLKRSRVMRDITGTIPPVPSYDVYQPVAKQLYKVDLETQMPGGDLTMTLANTWSGTCNQPELLFFDFAGRPRCGDPWGVLLESESLTLTWSGHTRVVAIDGETGRVTIQ